MCCVARFGSICTILSLKIIVKVKETRLNVKDRNKIGKPNLDFNLKKSPEKKVTITRDSMIKYLRTNIYRQGITSIK